MLNSSFIVNADNDGDVYYIDQSEILSWAYWFKHITNNDQVILLDPSTSTLSGSSVQNFGWVRWSSSLDPDTRTNFQNAGCTFATTDQSGVYDISCPNFANATITDNGSSIQLLFNQPFLKGTVTQTNTYSTADRLFQSNGVEYVHAFYANQNISGTNSTVYIHNSDGTNTELNLSNTGFTNDGGIYYVRWTGNGMWGTLDIPFLNNKSSVNISPIYLGHLKGMTDDLRMLCNIPLRSVEAISDLEDTVDADLLLINGNLTSVNTKLNTINTTLVNNLGNIDEHLLTQTTTLGGKLDTIHSDVTTTNTRLNTTNGRLNTIITLLREGNSGSQAAVNSNDSKTSDLNTAESTYHEAEVSQLDNMDDAFEDINSGSNVISDSKFLSTANWVATQFNNIVLTTPFELLITFSLTLGLALVFIGKVR